MTARHATRAHVSRVPTHGSAVEFATQPTRRRRAPMPAAARGPDLVAGRQRVKRRQFDALIEKSIRNLAQFVRMVWHIVEPATPLVWNWHIDVICEELQDIIREWAAGRGCECVICVPPGHMKSLLVSVFWPAWIWLRYPSARGLFLANSDTLISRDSRRCRDIIESELYQRMIAQARGHSGVEWELKDDHNRVLNYGNTAQGSRSCVPIKGHITGQRGDFVVIDDPCDAKEVILGGSAMIAAHMQRSVDVYRGAVSTRLNDQRAGVRVLIMQRLHPADLAGWIMENPAQHVRARRVVLSSSYDPARAHPRDPRTEVGSPLFPAKFPVMVLEALKSALQPVHFARQFEQLATAIEGALLRVPMLRIHDGKAHLLCKFQIISVDAAFNDSDGSDYVSIQVWGKHGRDLYLIDQTVARMDYVATEAAVKLMRNRYPRAKQVLIEGAANGHALLSRLQHENIPVLDFKPAGVSKIGRAQLANMVIAEGRVYVPDAANNNVHFKVSHYCKELTEFPESANDDQVDATTQAILYLEHGVLSAAELRNQFVRLFEGFALMEQIQAMGFGGFAAAHAQAA